MPPVPIDQYFPTLPVVHPLGKEEEGLVVDEGHVPSHQSPNVFCWAFTEPGESGSSDVSTRGKSSKPPRWLKGSRRAELLVHTLRHRLFRRVAAATCAQVSQFLPCERVAAQADRQDRPH